MIATSNQLKAQKFFVETILIKLKDQALAQEERDRAQAKREEERDQAQEERDQALEERVQAQENVLNALKSELNELKNRIQEPRMQQRNEEEKKIAQMSFFGSLTDKGK